MVHLCCLQSILWNTMNLASVVLLLIVLAPIALLWLWIQFRSRRHLSHLRRNIKGEVTSVVAFFHPYCNAGGGGERVLWVAIRSIQIKFPDVKCVIYTGDTDVDGEIILQKARQRFNILLPNTSNVEFIFLKRRGWVEASRYPFLTLLGQSLGSMILGLEALLAFVPDIYVDSMGYAFTFPIFRYLGRCSVACYVHYPTISTDMLEKVSKRTESFNNASFISRSPVLSQLKLVYYKAFAALYGYMGRRSEVVMVNSSWTFGHIRHLWNLESRLAIVYPPCDITEFVKIPIRLKPDSDLKIILSIAQFRPEKDHPLQIKAFHLFLSNIKQLDRKCYKLILAGSCRNDDDLRRVENLQNMCEELNITRNVEFQLNISFDKLKELMARSMVGLHTMWNEHFGIGVVELMAAGTVILAHNSGGPKLDIVVPINSHRTGFLANDEESYADAMATIFQMSETKRLELRKNARESVNRFSEKEFENGFLSAMQPLMNKLL